MRLLAASYSNSRREAYQDSKDFTSERVVMSRASSLTCSMVALLAAVQVSNATIASTAVSYSPLEITAHETQEATSSDVENVKFVKFTTVDAAAGGGAASLLFLSLPGRVFIDYVDYQDGGDLVSSSTLLQIKASGDVLDLVDQVGVMQEDDSERIILETIQSAYLDEASATGHLLVEVSVFQPKSIRSVQSTSPDGRSLEVIITDGVAYSRSDTPEFAADLSGDIEYAGETSGPGAFESSSDTLEVSTGGVTSLYMQSPSTPLNLYELSVVAMDQSSVYIDGGAMVTSYDVAAIADPNTSVIAFFDAVQTDTLRLSAEDGGRICFSVSDSLETGSYNYVPEPANVALPGQKGGVNATGSFTCSRMKIPGREPRDISLATTDLTPSGESDSSVSSNGVDSGSAGPTAASEDNGVPGLLCRGIMAVGVSGILGLAIL